MGVASSPGPERPFPARRSIRSSFAVVVAVPIVCLVAGWAVAVLMTAGGSAVRNALLMRGHTDLAEVALYAGGGLVIVIVAVILMSLFAGRVSRDVSGLETTARRLADEKLPQIMMRLRHEGPSPEGEQSTIRLRPRTAEVARAAAAIADLQQTAIAAASDEASLRNGVAQVFVSLARRNQSLLQRQLRLIDALERKAADPAALADLFLLDHLTTRMRRHAENLIILSGANPGRSWSAPVPVIDVIRGAAAEVEDYQRIRVVTRTQDTVTGAAVADMIHLLAELVENAALFSPSDTRVDVRAQRVANGFVIEVEDRGLGIQSDLLRQLNHQLANPPDFAFADPDRLGLFVVAKLAARHGIRVTLSASPYGGTTAVALIPHTIVLPATEPGLDMRHSAGELTSGPEPRSGDSFVLTGRTMAGWPPSDEPAGQAELSPVTTGPIGTVSPIGAAASASAARSLDLGTSYDPGGPHDPDLGGPHDPGFGGPHDRDFATPNVRDPGGPHDRHPGGSQERGGPLDPGEHGSPVDPGGAAVIAGSLSPAGLPVRGGGTAAPAGQQQRAAEPPTMGSSPAFPDLPTLGDPRRDSPAGPLEPDWPAGADPLPSQGGPPPGTDGPAAGVSGPAHSAGGPAASVGGSPAHSAGGPAAGVSGLPERGSPASPGGLPRRGSVFGSGGLPSRGGPFAAEGPGGPAEPGAGAPGGRGPSQPPRSATAGTYRGLPRRVRQANLSPHLASASSPDVPEPALSPAPVPLPDRTPEEARAFVASFRTGWQRDEDTGGNDSPRDEDRSDTLGPPDGNGARVTEQQDSAASPTEER
jgi:signal transduction histidine kinase